MHAWSTGSGGSVLMRALTKNISKQNLFWIIIGKYQRTIPNWMDGVKVEKFSSFLFCRYFKWLIKHSPLKTIYWNIIYKWLPFYYSNKIISFIKKEKIDKLWVHASDYIIPIVAIVIKKTNIPVHLNIQDDIYAHHSVKEANVLRESFEYLLNNSTSIDVTSKSMRDYYIENYGVGKNAFVLGNGWFEGNKLKRPEIKKKIKKIAYAGNIWSPENFRSLGVALDEINENRSESDQIKLYIYSSQFQKHFNIKNKSIVYAGYLPEDKILFALQDYDLLYVPMTFEVNKEIICKTSLPGKLLAYMNSMVPLFAHGPEYASNISFVRDYKVGFTCTSNKTADIINTIKTAENSYSLRDNCGINCQKLINEKFSEKNVWESFQKVLFKL